MASGVEGAVVRRRRVAQDGRGEKAGGWGGRVGRVGVGCAVVVGAILAGVGRPAGAAGPGAGAGVAGAGAAQVRVVGEAHDGVGVSQAQEVYGGVAAATAADVRASRGGARIGDYLAYGTEKVLSGGAAGKGMALVVSSSIVIGIGGMALYRFQAHKDEDERDTLMESLWKSYFYVVNVPGADIPSEEADTRVIGNVLFVFGLLVFAILVGLVTDAIDSKVEEMKAGKGRVLESQHTVVLGWNSKGPALVRQLSEAVGRDAKARRCVAILCEEEKEDVEEQVREEMDGLDHRGLSVITRKGDPSSLMLQDMMSVGSAASVVVLASDSDEQELVDSTALRTVLATRSLEKRDGDIVPANVIVEVSSRKGAELVHMAGSHGAKDKSAIAMIRSEQLLGRYLVQCAGQAPGYGSVIQELISFEGSEFHVSRRVGDDGRSKHLVGRTWAEAVHGFRSALPVGVMAEDGTINLAVSQDYAIKASDKVIAVAEDEKDMTPVGEAGFSRSLERASKAPRSTLTGLYDTSAKLLPRSKHYVVLGYRAGMDDMIFQMAEMCPVGSGSRITVLADVDVDLMQRNLGPMVNKQRATLRLISGSPTRASELKKCDLATAYSIMLVGDTSSSVFDDEDGIAETLVTDPKHRDIQVLAMALGVREELARLNARIPLLVTEIQEQGTMDLLGAINVNMDIIVATDMVANILAQAAHQPDVMSVWNHILKADGCEIYMKPASKYMNLALDGRKPCTFRELHATVKELYNEEAIGIVTKRGKRHCLKFDLDKSDVMLQPGDYVVVIAEEAD